MNYFLKLATFCLGLSVFPISMTQADIVLHYTGDNTANDSSGNGYDAVINGAGYSQGVIGNGFQFTGSNQEVIGPAILEIDPNQFSIAMWINASASSGLRLLADSSHGGTRDGSTNWEGFALQLNGANQVDFAWGNGTTFPHVSSTVAVADNTFHHIAATFDGTDMLLYVDGSLDNSVTYSGTAVASQRPFRLGRHDLLGRQFIGTMDDVRVYNNVLNASQVASLASVPEPSSCILLGIGCIAVATKRNRRHG